MGPAFCILLCLGSGTPPAVTVTGCPHIVERSADWQKRLSSELAVLPREAQEALLEWKSLRDQSRACKVAGNPR